MYNFTEKEEIILNYIFHYTNIHQYSPSVREITKAIGHHSPSSTFNYLQKFKELGVLDYVDKSPRTIVLKGVKYQCCVDEDNIGFEIIEPEELIRKLKEYQNI